MRYRLELAVRTTLERDIPNVGRSFSNRDDRSNIISGRPIVPARIHALLSWINHVQAYL